jgi:NAD(P)-dependent dehydrogenase (short-subunit alcohol dehydrogenase family)
MQLKGKVVLVTGASSGIGKAIASAFAHKRAHVLVHYGKNKTGAEETLKEVEKFSSGGLYQADLMNRERITSLFNEIKQTTQAIDVLVNNAGDARPGDINDDHVWEYEYENILAPRRLTRQSHTGLAHRLATPRRAPDSSPRHCRRLNMSNKVRVGRVTATRAVHRGRPNRRSIFHGNIHVQSISANLRAIPD